MSVTICPVTPDFAAEIGDVDLSAPLSEADIEAVDNRCTMHRGTDYDDLRWVRDMRRATCMDVANTCVQEGVALPA